MNRLKELKEYLHKTSKELAADLGVSHYTIDSWLTGNRKPRLSNIKHIEKEYNLNPGWLLGETDTMFKAEPSSEDSKDQLRELMTCKSSFAVETVHKLTQATDSEWEVLEKILK